MSTRYGVINKNTNTTEYSYVYHRMKNLSYPYDAEYYVQYIIEEGKTALEYIWDDVNEQVILNPSYEAPSTNYDRDWET